MSQRVHTPSPVKAAIARELHRPARRLYHRRHVITRGVDDLWQADLVEMIPYAKANNGVNYLLTVIDVYSKMAFVEPVRNKSAQLVTAAFKTIVQRSRRQPRLLQTDQGKEFFNKTFSAYLKSLDIHHYSTFSNLKASVVERFNRTLKTRMWEQFTARGSYRWLELVGDLVTRYNNTKHRTIKMKPRLVTKNIAQLDRIHHKIKTVDPRRHQLRIGDYVRISKHKTIFAKGYTPNWSTEIFRIRKVKLSNPVVYLLDDLNKQPIQGGFYMEELQRTQYPKHYLVEKIVQKRGNKLFVKWLGFNATYNSWINKSDLVYAFLFLFHVELADSTCHAICILPPPYHLQEILLLIH